MKTYVAMSFVVATFALGACSKEPAAGGSGASPEPIAIRACELLTPSEIETATGFRVDPGRDVSQAAGQLPMCHWPRAGSELDIAVSLTVTGAGHASFEEFVASARDSAFGNVLNEAEIEEVPAEGGFGVWMRDAKMLQVYSGNRMVQVDASVADGRDELEASQALARAALARLR